MKQSPYYSSSDVEIFKNQVERYGWEFYESRRLLDVIAGARKTAILDLKIALESSILILDGNGPEVPTGSAVLAGMALAERKNRYCYIMGNRRLMLMVEKKINVT